MAFERVLIVGHGSIGQRHLRLVRESLPGADIRVLRHQPSDDVPEFANGIFSNLAAACAFGPQVAVIANPAPFHVDTARGLIEAGAHLLVEKPSSHDSAGVADLLRRARETGRVFQVGYNLRFLPSLERFRECVQAALVGRILSVRCEIGQYLPDWRPGTDYRQGVSARQALGGGALLELSHELDYLRWIFGEVAWVNAWIGKQSALEIDVEDSAHLTLGFAPDAAGNRPVAVLSLDFIRRDTTRQCVAIGETGSLRWNGIAGTVEHLAPGKGWQMVFQHTPGRDESYRAQWRHFLGCVRDGAVPRVDGADGLAVVNLVAAARQSSAAWGARVTVPGI